MDTKELASAYAVAKICGYTGLFDDYSEIIKSLPEEEPQLANIEAVANPFRNPKHF